MLAWLTMLQSSVNYKRLTLQDCCTTEWEHKSHAKCTASQIASAGHGMLGRLTNLAIPSVKDVAQLDHDCVAPTPQRPVSSGVHFQAPCYLQRCHCLLYVAMDVPDCSTRQLFCWALHTKILYDLGTGNGEMEQPLSWK